MPITHRKVSTVPASGNSDDIQTTDWNDTHVVTLTVVAYAADVTVADDDEFVAGTGGSAGITLTLPDPAASGGRVLTFKKMDSAIGGVMLDGPIDGETSYELVNQYQFVTLVSDGGASWMVFGGN